MPPIQNLVRETPDSSAANASNVHSLRIGVLVIRGDNAFLKLDKRPIPQSHRSRFGVACAEAELAELLATDPSGYVEIESTGVVRVYYLALFNDLIPLAHCYLG